MCNPKVVLPVGRRVCIKQQQQQQTQWHDRWTRKPPVQHEYQTESTKRTKQKPSRKGVRDREKSRAEKKNEVITNKVI